MQRNMRVLQLVQDQQPHMDLIASSEARIPAIRHTLAHPGTGRIGQMRRMRGSCHQLSLSRFAYVLANWRLLGLCHDELECLRRSRVLKHVRAQDGGVVLVIRSSQLQTSMGGQHPMNTYLYSSSGTTESSWFSWNF